MNESTNQILRLRLRWDQPAALVRAFFPNAKHVAPQAGPGVDEHLNDPDISLSGGATRGGWMIECTQAQSDKYAAGLRECKEKGIDVRSRDGLTLRWRVFTGQPDAELPAGIERFLRRQDKAAAQMARQKAEVEAAKNAEIESWRERARAWMGVISVATLDQQGTNSFIVLDGRAMQPVGRDIPNTIVVPAPAKIRYQDAAVRIAWSIRAGVATLEDWQRCGWTFADRGEVPAALAAEVEASAKEIA